MIDPVYQTLSELSRKSVQEIYSLFVAEGVKGKKGKDDSCPIATYVLMRTGEKVRVYETEVEYNWDIWTRDRFTNSTGMEEFVLEFDAGRFPELECPEVDPRQLVAFSDAAV